ncbi:hypothetical protein MICA_1912 [Micavibrio aeruginosavorus ARL-13]|uniref:Uncharacterized protein n=1 Tax=Micavibrio aeruginosavorus (strain ARL-13) TaxID=856793 RepID=G2KMC7_MICAA|nr:hypothetical protein MICA_1912 [Micavibrio aeruginosavorus ARL-13]
MRPIALDPRFRGDDKEKKKAAPFSGRLFTNEIKKPERL